MSCIDLPIVSFNYCVPTLNLSEISYVYVADIDAADFADWTDADEWNRRLSNDGTVPDGSTVEVIDLIRKLTVIADMPAPVATEKEISGLRTAEIKTSRILNIEIDETNATNYSFIKATETITGLKVKVWFKTKANVKFGGNSGITGILKMRPVLNRGADELEKYVGTFKWNSLESPARFSEGVDTDGSLSGETGGTDTGVNQKLRVTFTAAESTKEIVWDEAKVALYGNFPIFQVWSTDPKQLISIEVTYDDTGANDVFTFYLPGTDGFIQLT